MKPVLAWVDRWLPWLERRGNLRVPVGELKAALAELATPVQRAPFLFEGDPIDLAATRRIEGLEEQIKTLQRRLSQCYLDLSECEAERPSKDIEQQCQALQQCVTVLEQEHGKTKQECEHLVAVEAALRARVAEVEKQREGFGHAVLELEQRVRTLERALVGMIRDGHLSMGRVAQSTGFTYEEIMVLHKRHREYFEHK